MHSKPHQIDYQEFFKVFNLYETGPDQDLTLFTWVEPLDDEATVFEMPWSKSNCRTVHLGRIFTADPLSTIILVRSFR